MYYLAPESACSRVYKLTTREGGVPGLGLMRVYVNVLLAVLNLSSILSWPCPSMGCPTFPFIATRGGKDLHV